MPAAAHALHLPAPATVSHPLAACSANKQPPAACSTHKPGVRMRTDFSSAQCELPADLTQTHLGIGRSGLTQLGGEQEGQQGCDDWRGPTALEEHH